MLRAGINFPRIRARRAAYRAERFFDLSDRYASLDAKKDPLLEIEGIVPWEEFRSLLKKKDWRRPNWGAPPGPDGEIYLPETEVVCNECRDLLLQISKKSARIEVRTKTAKKLAETTDTARRLQTMLGVGPMTVLPVEAFAPDMAGFRRGRDFSGLAGSGPEATLLGRQGTPRLGLQGWRPTYANS